MEYGCINIDSIKYNVSAAKFAVMHSEGPSVSKPAIININMIIYMHGVMDPFWTLCINIDIIQKNVSAV